MPGQAQSLPDFLPADQDVGLSAASLPRHVSSWAAILSTMMINGLHLGTLEASPQQNAFFCKSRFDLNVSSQRENSD